MLPPPAKLQLSYNCPLPKWNTPACSVHGTHKNMILNLLQHFVQGYSKLPQVWYTFQDLINMFYMQQTMNALWLCNGGKCIKLTKVSCWLGLGWDGGTGRQARSSRYWLKKALFWYHYIQGVLLFNKWTVRVPRDLSEFLLREKIVDLAGGPFSLSADRQAWNLALRDQKRQTTVSFKIGLTPLNH